MKTEAMLYEPLNDGRVHCYLCAHHCKIADSKLGVCQVRQNAGGKLQTLVYAEAITVQVDPIEKKPLYHFLPGSRSFSIATRGCNFQCGFCQNWQLSQADRENIGYQSGQYFPPNQIVALAHGSGCDSISYTYTEPTIFFEYAYDISRLAKSKGVYNVFVTNGFMTKEASDTIAPYLDAANIDLKSFSDAYYKRVCKARLQPVLDSIAHMHQLGIWVEVTTLLIPGKNDSDEELDQIAEFIVGVNQQIPWHISRFHPHYKFSTHQSTSLKAMQRAREIGWKHGLKYVYLGNVPEGTDTYCPQCHTLIVRRSHMGVEEMRILDDRCPKCGTIIAGRW